MSTPSFVALLLYCTFGIIKAQTCVDQADIAIVIDDSESLKIYDVSSDSFINAADYSTFVAGLLASFDSANQQVGLISFSKTSQVLSPLTFTYATVQSALDARTPEFNTHNTEVGIQAAIDMLAAGRVGANKYCILLTDGNSMNTAATKAKVIEAGAADVIFIVVDLRSDFGEGLVIAGRSYREITIATPGDLAASTIGLTTSIDEIVCPVCKGEAEVLFLLDGSDSTSRLNFTDFTNYYAEGVTDFVADVTRGIEGSDVRTGVILFSQTSQDVIGLTTDQAAVRTAVNNMVPEFLNTNAGLAFTSASNMFDVATPQRPDDTRRVIIYLVDGQVTNLTNLAQEAEKVRAKGVEVFAVGFAPAALEIDLFLASGNQNNIFRTTSDIELASGVDGLVDYICQTPTSLTVDDGAVNAGVDLFPEQTIAPAAAEFVEEKKSIRWTHFLQNILNKMGLNGSSDLS